MAQLLEQFINGLVLGGIYALIAVGYTMVYGIIQLINFAHGEIFMFGAYLALMLITVFNIPFWIALPASMLLCALLGMLIDLVAYRPLRDAPRFISVDYSDRHISRVTKPRPDDLVSKTPAISDRNAASIPRQRSQYANRRDFKRNTAARRRYSPLPRRVHFLISSCFNDRP